MWPLPSPNAAGAFPRWSWWWAWWWPWSRWWACWWPWSWWWASIWFWIISEFVSCKLLWFCLWMWMWKEPIGIAHRQIAIWRMPFNTAISTQHCHRLPNSRFVAQFNFTLNQVLFFKYCLIWQRWDNLSGVLRNLPEPSNPGIVKPFPSTQKC